MVLKDECLLLPRLSLSGFRSAVLSAEVSKEVVSAGSKHTYNSIRKFARDSSRGVNFPCQQNGIQELEKWSGENHLSLNVSMTKKSLWITGRGAVSTPLLPARAS